MENTAQCVDKLANPGAGRLRVALFLFALVPIISFSCASSGATCLYGDCENGFGRSRRVDNLTLSEGQFKNGVLHGSGTMRSADGDVYEGQFKDGLQHGTGTYRWAHGDVYEGQHENGEKHGTGTYRWADGRVYEGQFKDGLKHGTGTFVEVDGQVFSGTWQHGALVSGRWTQKDGSYYEGNFEQKKRHGIGTQYARDGTVVSAGTWQHGALVSGRWTQKDGSYYEGNFKQMKRDGIGTQYARDGSVVSAGMWREDKYLGAIVSCEFVMESLDIELLHASSGGSAASGGAPYTYRNESRVTYNGYRYTATVREPNYGYRPAVPAERTGMLGIFSASGRIVACGEKATESKASVSVGYEKAFRKIFPGVNFSESQSNQKWRCSCLCPGELVTALPCKPL